MIATIRARRAVTRAAPLEQLEPRTFLSATLTSAVAGQTVLAGQSLATVNLASHFNDPTLPAGDTVVEITTNLPAPNNVIPLYLTDAATPGTVANFLKYVTSGAYANTIIHRSVPGFIVQGGGYTAAGVAVTSLGTIPGESATATLRNTAGTIAMALTGTPSAPAPNSGTDEWFFNLAANSQLDDASDGGPFTAFGKVVYNGLATLDAIAAEPVVDDYGQGGGAWSTLPVLSGTVAAGSAVASVPAADLVTLTPAVVPGGLTYAATSSNTALVTPTISGGTLTLTPVAGATGTATITVFAADLGQGTATSTFDVTINPGPTTITVTPPAGQTATAGTATSFALGSFAQTNGTGPYTATVSWGDESVNTTVALTAAGAIPAQSHTYAAAGTDTVSVYVTDSAGHTSDTVSFAATVAAPPPQIASTAATGQSATASEASPFSLGTFTAVSAAGPYTVTVDWGDGSADTSVTQPGAGAIAAVPHTYATAGTDTVTVTIADAAGDASGTSTFTATVAQPPGLAPTVDRSTVAESVVTGSVAKGTVTVSLTNTTTALNKGASVVRLFAVLAGVADPTQGTLLGTVQRKLTVKAGGSVSVAVPVKVALPAGTYTLLPVATNVVGTVVTATDGPTLTVAAPTVSLTAVASTVTAAAAPGKPITVALTVTNGGNIPSAGPATISLALSVDGVAVTVPVATLRKSFTVKPGKAVSLRLTAKLASGQAAGKFYPLLSLTQGTATATAVGTVLNLT